MIISMFLSRGGGNMNFSGLRGKGKKRKREGKREKKGKEKKEIEKKGKEKG